MRIRATRLVLLLALLGAAPAAAAPTVELEFVGLQTFPTATQFQGTAFGGLSGFAYDERRGVFYALSDDQVGARFYTLRIGVAGGAPAVQILAVTTLRDAAGQPFAPFSLDPEGLEPRLRERRLGAERPLPLHRQRGGARAGRPARHRRRRQPGADPPLGTASKPA